MAIVVAVAVLLLLQKQTTDGGVFSDVFNQRSTPTGIRYAKAKVSGVNGVILLPDNWIGSIYSLNNTNQSKASYSSNSISASTWGSVFAPAGAIFLPAAGARLGTSVNSDGSDGAYYSSSPDGSDGARYVFFIDGIIKAGNWSSRGCGNSVRLVRPVMN